MPYKSPAHEPHKPARRFSWSIILVLALFLATPVLCLEAWRWMYPYGRSHCCDKVLVLALLRYASEHEGNFPTGKSTPEASLSLLYPEYIDAHTLRGKTVPETVVKGVLENGGLLGPDTCGWHYVAGLRMDDGSQLALFWDKAGLDHNGGRMRSGGHIVSFIDGHSEHIPGSRWAEFLSEQRRLCDALKEARGGRGPLRREAEILLDGRKLKLAISLHEDCLYASWIEEDRSWCGPIAAMSEVAARSTKLPLIEKTTVENAEVVVDEQSGEVRFSIGDLTIIYDGAQFHVHQQGYRHDPNEQPTAGAVPPAEKGETP